MCGWDEYKYMCVTATKNANQNSKKMNNNRNGKKKSMSGGGELALVRFQIAKQAPGRHSQPQPPPEGQDVHECRKTRKESVSASCVIKKSR